MDMLITELLIALFVLPWLCAFLLEGAVRTDNPDTFSGLLLLSGLTAIVYFMASIQLYLCWMPPFGLAGIAIIILTPLIPLTIALEVLRRRRRKRRAKYRVDY